MVCYSLVAQPLKLGKATSWIQCGLTWVESLAMLIFCRRTVSGLHFSPWSIFKWRAFFRGFERCTLFETLIVNQENEARLENPEKDRGDKREIRDPPKTNRGTRDGEMIQMNKVVWRHPCSRWLEEDQTLHLLWRSLWGTEQAAGSHSSDILDSSVDVCRSSNARWCLLYLIDFTRHLDRTRKRGQHLHCHPCFIKSLRGTGCRESAIGRAQSVE